MIRPMHALFRSAVLAAIVAAAPAAADTPAQLRAALSAASRDAAELRREYTLAQMSPETAIRFEQRLNALERVIRELTSKLDDLDAKQRDMARDFERYKTDTEFRITQIEKSPARAAAPQRAAPDRAPPDRAPPERAAPPPDRKPPPGQRGDRDEPRPGDGEPVRGAAPEGGAKEQYDQALALLRRSDYRGAETALADFIKRHPADPMAANAYYWLGETLYAQAKYQNAAFQFADGYRKFPNHARAQDILFKLGMSFARQNKGAEACATFGEFRRRYPGSGLRREAESEQKRLKCPG